MDSNHKFTKESLKELENEPFVQRIEKDSERSRLKREFLRKESKDIDNQQIDELVWDNGSHILIIDELTEILSSLKKKPSSSTLLEKLEKTINQNIDFSILRANSMIFKITTMILSVPLENQNVYPIILRILFTILSKDSDNVSHFNISTMNIFIINCLVACSTMSEINNGDDEGKKERKRDLLMHTMNVFRSVSHLLPSSEDIFTHEMINFIENNITDFNDFILLCNKYPSFRFNISSHTLVSLIKHIEEIERSEKELFQKKTDFIEKQINDVLELIVDVTHRNRQYIRDQALIDCVFERFVRNDENKNNIWLQVAIFNIVVENPNEIIERKIANDERILAVIFSLINENDGEASKYIILIASVLEMECNKANSNYKSFGFNHQMLLNRLHDYKKQRNNKEVSQLINELIQAL